jgi:peptidoglycan/xylan/chitin deacetylase (PgdA/CDA1 family)
MMQQRTQPPPIPPIRKKRVFGFGLLIFAQVLLILALWSYHAMLIELYDGTAQAVLKQLFLPFSTPEPVNVPRIAILRSEQTAQYYFESRDKYLGLADQWREYLSRQGWDVRIISDKGIADGLNRYDTLVLPAATVLSDDQTRAIKQFLREGNGVILTWATGTRDENGQWRDFPLLAEVCGMKYMGEVEPLIAPDLDQPSTRDLIFSSPSPITANIPPGLRLPVNLYDNPIGMEPVEPRITVDATWPLDQHGADVPPTAAAIVHGEYLGGRFVWMSFTFGSPMGSPRTETYYPELLNNAVAWVSKQPIAFKPIWPSDYESAMLVSHATYNDFSNIPDFLALLQRNSIRGTLYCGSDQAGLYPDSLRSFAETANEVASMGDTLSSFVGQSESMQNTRLANSKRTLEELTNRTVSGFLPPDGQLEEATVKALLNQDYLFVVPTNLDRDAPSLRKTQKGTFAISRPKNLFTLPSGSYQRSNPLRVDPEEYSGTNLGIESLLKEAREVQARRGLYHLMLPPAAFASRAYEDAVDELIQEAVQNKTWVTTSKDMVEWWYNWAFVKVRANLVAGRQLRLAVSNAGDRKIEKIVVTVILPHPIDNPKIVGEKIGVSTPTYTLEDQGKTWHLTIEDLRPRENRLFRIAPESSLRDILR